MSWDVVARVFKTKVGTASAKAVLVALANHCDEQGGSCFPGQEVIHGLTELSMDTIQRQIPVLISSGFIVRKKRPGIRGRWASWSYEIQLDKLADQAAPCGPDDRAAPCGPESSDQTAPCGVTEPHHAASPGRTMRLKPILKPINKPSRAREPSSPDGLGPLGAAIRSRIGADSFISWFGRASIVSATEDTVTIELPTPFSVQQVENRFGDAVLACLKAQQSTIEHVRFTARAA